MSQVHSAHSIFPVILRLRAGQVELAAAVGSVGSFQTTWIASPDLT